MAECALVCIPYAGGAASVFNGWQTYTDLLDIVPVQLPGRANRIAEAPVTGLPELVESLVPEVSALDRTFALFGHSMGALVAFELARRLRDLGLPGPRALYVSGYQAPDAPLQPPVYDLPRDELVRWLVEIGGIDESLAREDELLDVLLPALRADLGIVDTYRYRAGAPLPWPIRVLVGADDPSCQPADIAGWGAHSSAGCEVDVLPGDHFFVHDQAERIVALAERDLATMGGVRA